MINEEDIKEVSASSRSGKYEVGEDLIEFLREQVRQKGAIVVPRDKIEEEINYNGQAKLKGFAVQLDSKLPDSIKAGYRKDPNEEVEGKVGDTREGHLIKFVDSR